MELTAQIREKKGNQVKSLRRQGLLPAILYGYKHKESGTPLQVQYLDFERIFKEAGESTIVKLKIKQNGEGLKIEERDVLIHEVKLDPITGKFIHADFYEIRMDEEIEVAVPLIFIGEPPAIKSVGGTLVKNMQEVEVKALPKDLPRHIEVNVESLASFDEHICIKDLKVPAQVKILADAEEVVALVVPPRKEEEAEAPPMAEETAVEEEKEGGVKEEEKVTTQEE